MSTSSTSTSDIDSDTPSDTFNREEWIGVGRILPENPNLIPTGLANLFALLLQVPSHVKAAYYPSPSLDVSHFIAFSLPEQTHSLPKIHVVECFSSSVPNEHEDNFLTHRLPAHHFVDESLHRFRQAVLDGMKTIVHPAFPGSYLPLWCIQFWNDMWKLYEKKGEWKNAAEWLDENSNSAESELFRCARQTFGTLRWNEETDISGANRATTLDFASFLSHNAMMSTVHMDMMFAYLSELLGEQGTTHVETMRFWFEIDQLKSEVDLEKRSKRFMKQIEHRIADNEIKVLIMPCFLTRQSHWLTIKIDFADKTITYGDSLSHKKMPPPTQMIQKLGWWSKDRLGIVLRDLGDVLPHGEQDDWTDCGIVAVNTAFHEIDNNRPLWTPQRKRGERVWWFLILLCQHILDINHNVHRVPYPQPFVDWLTSSTKRHSLNALVATEANEAEKRDEESNTQKKRRHIEDALAESNTGGKVAKLAPQQSTLEVDDSVQVITSPAARSEQYNRFQAKILAIDKYAEIIDIKTIRHPKCGKKLAMKAKFNTQNFKTHVINCKGPTKASKLKLSSGGMRSITHWFQPAAADQHDITTVTSASQSLSQTKQPGPHRVEPCPGLDEQRYKQVGYYLDRTAAGGGGAPSVNKLSCELYNKKYMPLSKKRKQKVKATQRHRWLWRNDHGAGKVFAKKCNETVSVPFSLADEDVLPCERCLSVLHEKKFKNACLVEQKPSENLKYLNKEYVSGSTRLLTLYAKSKQLVELMDNVEDSHARPILKYVNGLISGKFKEDQLFADLIEAMYIKDDKKQRGKGLQNMRYSPNIVEFSHILLTHSPRAYKQLREFLPLPTQRTLQVQRTRTVQFPIGIQSRTFDLAAITLQKLDYSGPVALSCDDTKLLPSVRPYYDKEKDAYFVLGHVGEPYQLVDPGAFEGLITSGQLEKATKLRLFCLQVPLTRIPAIIISALSISDKMGAEDLLKYLWDILTGLLSRGIKVSSYASDGSSVERSLQRMLESRATHTKYISIKHPREGARAEEDIKIPIHFFGSQPIATLQDPKHLLKTFRNNLYSGARLLTLPNHVLHYSQVRDMAMADDSPIYRRDVEKVDRQDDNAAARLFSGDALQWLSKHAPEQRGLISYLFICGELIDAYQSRSLPLSDRIQMVWRAYFFFELWEKFLEAGGYQKAKHYVSNQCADIMRTVVHGFIQLVVIYRDHGERVPLLPWLLSTEVIEHVFGMCRQIIKDFTMLDFYNMIPKLFIKLREEFFKARVADPKARASGYSHTHLDIHGVDFAALSAYVTNVGIQEAAGRGYEEAHSIFAFLGITAPQLYNSVIRLPGISTWYSEVIEDEDEDGALSMSPDLDLGDYQQLLEDIENLELPLEYENHALMRARFATIALSVEEQQIIQSLPELDEEAMDEAFSDDAAYIAAVISELQPHALPPVNDPIPSDPFNVFNPSFVDLTEFVRLRFAHQTAQAAKGTRTTNQSLAPEASAILSERQRILRYFAEIIKRHDGKGVGTGLERAARWKNAAACDSNEANVSGNAGNSANAAAAAKTAWTKALKHRQALFGTYDLPIELGDARIDSVSTLQATTFGFILSSNKKIGITISKVLAIYSRSGGNKGAHSWVPSVSAITAASYITVQVYEHHFGIQFSDKPPSHAFPLLKCFDMIPSSHFLYTLKHVPQVSETGLKISADDFHMFKILKMKLTSITPAVSEMSKRKRSTQNELELEE